MPSRRDEFPPKVKDTLAKRVNLLCSNPKCGQVTGGPHEDPFASINVGVAAHITAAASGGKRHDPGLSPEERRHPNNGIWLCQSCAKLIDSDELKYTVEILRSWKRSAESAASDALERGTPPDLPKATDSLPDYRAGISAYLSRLRELGE